MIINADDFGWTDGHNQAVEQSHRNGILNSASLMTTTPGFKQGVEISKAQSNLRIGVHLVLNETMPVLKPAFLPGITRPDGQFRESIREVIGLQLRGLLKKDLVIHEWRAQIEKALMAGVSVSHLDSHKHVHLFPALLECVITLAKEYNIRYVRLPFEPPSRKSIRRIHFLAPMWFFCLTAKIKLDQYKLQYADHFEGFTHSGEMTQDRLSKALQLARPGKTIEIMVHPAKLTRQVRHLQKKYKWASQYQFERELKALISLRE